MMAWPLARPCMIWSVCRAAFPLTPILVEGVRESASGQGVCGRLPDLRAVRGGRHEDDVVRARRPNGVDRLLNGRFWRLQDPGPP